MKRIFTALLLTTLPALVLQAETLPVPSTSGLVSAPKTFTYSQPNSIPTFDRVQNIALPMYRLIFGPMNPLLK